MDSIRRWVRSIREDFEAGIRGSFAPLRLHADVALFRMRISDRLLPRQSADGRTWYANGGRNDHRGIEVTLRWPQNSRLQLRTAIASGHYEFLTPPERGLQVPGVPSRQGQISLQFVQNGISAEAAVTMASGTWTDSANTTRAEGHVAVNLYAAHTGISAKGITAQPFLGITNALDARYAAALVVNAFGSRYFEPAPGRTWQAGLSISL